MLKKFKKQMKNEKGLTLIELLAVIVILAIIAAIAIPAIGGIIQSSREKAVIADAQNVLAAADLYFLENTPVSAGDEIVKTSAVESKYKPYLDSPGKLTSATVTYVENAENKIVFSGVAGSKTVSSTAGVTKTELSDKDVLKNAEANKVKVTTPQ
ncbi:prepilin-type N-terminal cleavage/methylation domain-containing protein [Sporosarcina sp. CAU 1771]